MLWCPTTRRQHQLPTTPLLIDGCSVIPVSTVCDLSIYIDSNLSMRLQVKHTLSRCFASLRGLRQIRSCVPPATVQMMVVALAHSKLDYGNGVLVGLPVYLMRQLQSVFNAAAQLSFRLKSSDHITDALISLHWLRVPEQIHYKLAVMAYKVLHGRAPSYLGPLVRIADVSGRRALRSAGTNRILVPPVTSTTVGSRAFSVAGPLTWNSLPDDVISAESLPTFRRKLKRHLFCQSFSGFCY